ncbi:MAG: hypothetical protein QW472_05565 [Candidatus Aenigmatarchaeota archaeon]
MKIWILSLTYFFTFFLIVSGALGNVGIGMGPPRVELTTNTQTPYSIGLLLYNPGDYDIKARITIECYNCEEKVYVFGFYLGRIRTDYSQFLRIEPEEVYVATNATPETPVYSYLKIRPSLWVKKEFIISTPEEINFLVRMVNPNYRGEFAIPYYTLLLDEKEIKGGITATAVWSSFGTLGAAPAVGSSLNLRIKGMPTGSLILIIVAILIIIFGIVWKTGIYKRIFRKKLPSS